MSEDNVAPGGGEPITVVTPASNAPSEFSARDAGAFLARHRHERAKEAKAEPAAAPEAAAPQEAAEPEPHSGEQPEAAAPVEAQEGGEQTQAPDPEPEADPPIEPPRSWTKEAKEHWSSLPRATQEYVAQREQERERELRRGQNEAAEKLKGLSAKEQAVETARQQYEAALPALLQTLQSQAAGEFADIKSMADVEKLSRDDPFRYLQWHAHQQKVGAVQHEISASQQRQTEDYKKQWNEFAQKQDEAFVEKNPDFADKVKAAKLQESAVDVLQDHGFTREELGALYTGQATVSLRDARLQQLILDAVKYRDGQKAIAVAAEKAKAKPVPPVVRPGVAPPKGQADEARIQALTKKLEQSGSPKDALALTLARRAARR